MSFEVRIIFLSALIYTFSFMGINYVILKSEGRQPVGALLMIEFLTTALGLLLLYVALKKSLERDRRIHNLVEAVFMHLTHHLGNFLSVQKVNIDLLPSDAALRRLRESIEAMEEDYRRSLFVLRTILEGRSPERRSVDLGELIESVSRGLEDRGVRIKIRKGGRIRNIHAVSVYLELFFLNLLENAVKHSKGTVYVRVCSSRRGTPVVIIRNDTDGSGEGTGLGLRISQLLAKRLRIDLRYRIKRKFTLFVIFTSRVL